MVPILESTLFIKETAMNAGITSTVMPGWHERLQGDVIFPGDERYDRSRRVWNGRIDRYPALAVYCTSVNDILTTIDFARSAGLPITVRSGGHSMVGLSVT